MLQEKHYLCNLIMIRLYKIAVVVAAVALAGGCREMPHPFEYDRVVAQVGDSKLRESDLQSLNLSVDGKDSLAMLELYVDKWVKKELKLRAAETLFRDSEEDIEAMVAEYRNSLLMRRLDQHYVDQKLDTTFTDAQIAEYYDRHPSDFRLDRTVVKGRQVRVPTSFRQAGKLRELMRSSSEEKLQDWRDICQKNNLDVQEFDTWVEYSDFLATLPTRRGRDYTDLLRRGELQDMSDADGRYYFILTDIRREGEAAPLERVRETIRRILFNQRQSEIIRSEEERIYREADQRGDIKINIDRAETDDRENETK